MNVLGYSLFLDAVEARPSVTSISVHLHIENTTGSLTYDLGYGVLGEELLMWKRNRSMFVHGVSTPSSYGE
jgi:hypothetical protein